MLLLKSSRLHPSSSLFLISSLSTNCVVMNNLVLHWNMTELKFHILGHWKPLARKIGIHDVCKFNNNKTQTISIGGFYDRITHATSFSLFTFSINYSSSHLMLAKKTLSTSITLNKWERRDAETGLFCRWVWTLIYIPIPNRGLSIYFHIVLLMTVCCYY